MKRLFFISIAIVSSIAVCAQGTATSITQDFTVEKLNKATEVKNQAITGTCWSFSTTALVESQFLKNNNAENIDLSEMFTVRNIYMDKARNYIMRQGAAQFGEGALGHDVINAISKYGAMPEAAYSGLTEGKKSHDHSVLAKELKNYLDTVLKSRPLPMNWMEGYAAILDKYLGTAPASFDFNGKTYTAQSFATSVLKFKADDYVNITSFTHKPYYSPFIIDIPDNFSNGSYYNLPLNEMIELAKSVLKNGYTFMWDADVSNKGFRQQKGLALHIDPAATVANDNFTLATPEARYDAATRQRLFEELVTQDDHLMQAAGLLKSKDGREFFSVKNSWGQQGPYQGYIQVSEAYFGMNTISLVVPKAALDKDLLNKLKIAK
jgi:bleomycin hydrolase